MAAVCAAAGVLVAATAACAGAGAGTPPAAPPPPAAHSAERVPLAAHALLTAIAIAGTRFVAVGDRGIVVLSDDGGDSWTQALDVPTQALLTGVCFRDAQHGVAVGHDAVILTTADAGRTWQGVHADAQAPGPLLDVWCGTDGRVIAVGAYSAYLASDDGGAHWAAVPFRPAPHPAPQSHSAAPESGAGTEYHLNRIVAGDGARLYIAAEAGRLYRSDDGGRAWRALASPYGGSFFGLLPLGGDAVLAYGLRGHLYRSTDAGASWEPVASGTLAMLDGGTRLPGGGAALVGLAGVVLVSRDAGRSFTLAQQADRAGLAAVATRDAQRLVVAGERGVRVVGLASAAGAPP